MRVIDANESRWCRNRRSDMVFPDFSLVVAHSLYYAGFCWAMWKSGPETRQRQARDIDEVFLGSLYEASFRCALERFGSFWMQEFGTEARFGSQGIFHDLSDSFF